MLLGFGVKSVGSVLSKRGIANFIGFAPQVTFAAALFAALAVRLRRFTSRPLAPDDGTAIKTIHLRDLKAGSLIDVPAEPVATVTVTVSQSSPTSDPPPPTQKLPASHQKLHVDHLPQPAALRPKPLRASPDRRSSSLMLQKRVSSVPAVDAHADTLQPAALRTPPRKHASSLALQKRASSVSAIEVPAEELCLGGCKGSPGAGGLSAADWLLTLSDESREAESAWLEKLTAEQFRVLRMKGTEEIHRGRYNDLTEEGVYVCAGCSQALYSSAHKFQSGHGWPAFCDNIPGALERNGTRKIEIVCSGCEGHIGHVFKSSRYPPPRRERHCVNSVSLRFIPGVTPS